MDLGSWLRSLGLVQYEAAFRENAINEAILLKLTVQDLKDIGVTAVGHRRVLLDAIAALRGETPPKQENAPSAATEPANKPNRVGGGLPEAERRQITVMFCDLVGSTGLSARLDPEELREIIGGYHRRCAEVITQSGGFVAKYMGDGVLAYFGYPHAHEHDAERAVRAALNLVEAIPKLATTAGSPLQVRVGIATGLVVVGDLIGAGAAQEQAVVGETPNLAARLQTLAEPGTVVIASSTRTVTGGLFEYRALGTVALKGLGDHVPAWQVLGAGTAESRFEALRVTTTPLVGRDEEIALLVRRWERAKQGEGSVALISGEPGIGKSRIAQTIVERLSGEPHTRLRYFCSPHHQDSALYPTITQLERAAGFRREDTAEERLFKLEAVLAQGTDELSGVVPLLAELLSIPTGHRYPPLNLAPQKRKEKTLHALLAQVEGLAACQPLLMVFEDVHWSDPTTRELLDLLIEKVPTLRALVIITCRPEFALPWVGRPQVTLLSLNRLSNQQRAEMIMRVTGGKALPKEIADQIVDRTDGVPLFIEELTKTVLESGVVIVAGDHYAVKGPVAPVAIPTTLHASLLARLDYLAPTREVAQIGAAIGRHFSHDLISAVAAMPQQQIDEALAQLVNAELIFRRGTPPDAEYIFKHALVQDVAYSTLLRSRRRQLHGRIASALEGQFREIVEAQPELLARHCAEADLVETAVDQWLKAGQQAMARGAVTEAVAQLRKGITFLSGKPDNEWRQEQELKLQIAVGQGLMAANGYSAPEVGESFARAHQLCEQLNWPPLLGQVLRGQFIFRLGRGELGEADRHAEEMRQLGKVGNDPVWQCFGSALSGAACFFRGNFIDASSHYRNALRLWNPRYRAFWGSPEDPYLVMLAWFAITLLCMGHVNEARSQLEEALTKARGRSPYDLTYVLSHSRIVDWAIWGVDSADAMLRSVEEVLAVSSERGFLLWVAHGNITRGWCLGVAARTTEAVALIRAGLAASRATGQKLILPFDLLMFAEVYGMAAQPKEGLDQLAEAIALAETTQERWAEAEMLRVRGKLLLSVHEPAAAENSFHKALTVARRQSAKFWELRAALELARLWRDQGKTAQAHDLLAPIYNWFTEGLDTPVLQGAKSLLDELAS